ncbi:MAG: ATPase family associated with various cellular activities (AAA) [Candidatus Dependentiae bacterium ADurb.Bin331]|nr:MAG: ATPase family associated with various cellular activities (AAA) [Candidatus Dependentiae bacterium ADurb.Bin331]
MELLNQDVIEQIKNESVRFHLLQHEVQKVIVGNENILSFVMIALLCDGHILLEGVPGVAKTTMIKAITQALGLHFKRIQFTPDLLPADLIGSLIYNPKTQEFETKKGPLFANLILADEINRTPAKVQAALLEAMQEQQVTIGSHTFELEKPFLVFATQNPIEQEGTYRLPEAQVDRFMFKLLIEYLSIAQEKQLLQRAQQQVHIQQVLTKQDIFTAQELVQKIYVDDRVMEYIVNVVFATRNPSAFKLSQLKPLIQYGVSPRATLGLYQAAQAHAFLKKRHFVTPDDVKAVAHPLLRHRISLSYEAEADNIKPDEIVTTILQTVSAP